MSQTAKLVEDHDVKVRRWHWHDEEGEGSSSLQAVQFFAQG